MGAIVGGIVRGVIVQGGLFFIIIILMVIVLGSRKASHL